MIQLSFILSDDNDRAIVQRCIEAADNYFKEKDEASVGGISSAAEEPTPPPTESDTATVDSSNPATTTSPLDEGTLFFEIIREGTLHKTNRYSAPYVAHPSEDNKYSYEFNVERGESKGACKDRDTILVPFCEIEDAAGDANAIVKVTAGEGTYDAATGIFTIVKKAKIKLI